MIKNFNLKSLSLALALAIVGMLTVAVAPATADAPNFYSGNGIIVYGWHWLAGSDRTLVVDISTPAVAPNAINGYHQVRVTLPIDYFQRPTVRYPVLYLLHGGAGGHSSQWTSGGGDVHGITHGKPIITVMPDGGKVGWYTNWINQSAGVQQWEHFHLYQLIPWIDANLRTIARKEGRAIAGLSMGGFGAIHYAQQRPDLFAYAASFSGALDLEDARIRTVITEQSAQNFFPIDGTFGWPFWPWDGIWKEQNPLRRASRLHGVHVTMYAGSGTDDLDILERTVGWSSYQMSLRLNSAGVPNQFIMYGRPGNSVPYGCNGGHNFGCWNYALQDVLPKMLQVLWHP